MSIILVLHARTAFSDSLEGVTSKDAFATSARVFNASYLLCLQLLAYNRYNRACSVNEIGISLELEYFHLFSRT